MNTENKVLIYLIVFAILDLIIPFPITAAILIYVILVKPVWFKDFVTDIYQ